MEKNKVEYNKRNGGWWPFMNKKKLHTHGWRRWSYQPLKENDSLGCIKGEIYLTSEAGEKLRLAFISMEGNAVQWYQYWHKVSENPSWEELTTMLLRRFRGWRRGLIKRLAALSQNTSVELYVQEFGLLVAKAPFTTNKQLLGYFLAGLHQNIKRKVCIHMTQKIWWNMEFSHWYWRSSG